MHSEQRAEMPQTSEAEQRVDRVLNRLVLEFSLRSFTVTAKIEHGADWLAHVGISRLRQRILIRLDAWSVKRMNDLALTGLLVHELCHAEVDLGLGWRVWVQRLSYGLFPSRRTCIERETDMRGIMKGFGAELLALGKFHDEHYDPLDGLTTSEIRDIRRKLPHKFLHTEVLP